MSRRPRKGKSAAPPSDGGGVELRLGAVTKTYGGACPVVALNEVDLTIGQGEYVAIVGPSGSGKSTLLNTLALLDTPDSGSYAIGGKRTEELSEKERTETRARTFGFVFQDFHLLERRSVLNNVLLGSMYRPTEPEQARASALRALEQVGLAHKADQMAATLSGGERQRVAIARAIAVEAPVLVADEPTGNLDSTNTRIVVDCLGDLNRSGITVILVTHEMDVAEAARRIVTMRDGRVVADQAAHHVPVSPAGGEAERTEPILLPVGGGLALPAAAAEADAGRGRRGRSGRGVRQGTPVSKVRARALLADAWAGVVSRAGRAAGLLAAVAVGVGLAVTTLGLSESARAQVSEAFDAHLNRIVTLSPGEGEHLADMLTPATLARLASLSGVDSVGIVASGLDQVYVAKSPGGPTIGAQLASMTPDTPHAAELSITWAGPDHRVGQGRVLIGATLAEDIQLGPLVAGPVVWVDGVARPVAGIVTSASRAPDMLSAVTFGSGDPAGVREPAYLTAHLIVQAGAAPQVARQGPIALAPWDAESVTVEAPPDPAGLRGQVEGEVRTMLLVLTGVAALAATISLANSMMMSVTQRTGEFGLRRAIGARRVHIKALVMAEATIYGFAGGMLGLFAGIIGLLGVTIAKGWIPVFDAALAPIAVLGGTVVGALGGLAAAIRAGRIEPSEALRS